MSYRDVFGVGEFRVLWLAQLLSVAGDQLARVSLTVLVFDRTRSALLAGITYAVTIIPVFVGGVLLGWTGDRFPRRAVLIFCDLARCIMVIIMAVPGMPLAVMTMLLGVVTLLSAPFTAARAAIYPDILAGARYVLGTTVTMTTYQLAQVLGFASGGAIIGLAGARPALAADAATFAVSAVLVRTGIRARPAPPRAASGHALSPLADARSGARLVFTTPALRIPMLAGWLGMFTVVPEGLAAPLARRAGGGDVLTGLILAASAGGICAGCVLFGRLPARYQDTWMTRLAAAACLLLVLVALPLPTPAVLAVLAASGGCCSYQVAANAAFVRAAPPDQRSQAFGLATAGIFLGEGSAIIVAGAAATRWPPAAVIAVAGALGTLAAAALLRQRRHQADG